MFISGSPCGAFYEYSIPQQDPRNLPRRPASPKQNPTIAKGQFSSVVEQRFCKPSVVGSNPTTGSISLPRVHQSTERESRHHSRHDCPQPGRPGIGQKFQEKFQPKAAGTPDPLCVKIASVSTNGAAETLVSALESTFEVESTRTGLHVKSFFSVMGGGGRP